MKKLIALIAASFMTLSINAATLNYTNYTSGYTDFTRDIPIPQFNPALGVLRGVIVQVQIIESRSIGFENQSSASQSFAATVRNEIRFGISNTTVFGIPNTVDNTYISSFPARKYLGAYDGTVDYAGTSGYRRDLVTTNSFELMVTNALPFSGYSVLPIRASVIGTSSGIFNGGSFSWFAADFVEIRVFISYTFDPCLLTSFSQERRFKRLA